MSRAAWVVGIAALGVLAAVLLMMLSPSTGPELAERPAPVVAAAAPAEKVASNDADEPAKSPIRPRLRREGAAVNPLLPRGGEERRLKVDPLQLKARRVESRAQNFESSRERLRAHAERAGWDAALLEQVEARLVASHEKVNTILLSVDEGELTWDDARPQMLAARDAESAEVRALLGDEAYRDFEAAMAIGTLREKRAVGVIPPGKPALDGALE